MNKRTAAYYIDFIKLRNKLDDTPIMHYNIGNYFALQDRRGIVIPSQMLKGTLEGCILAIISKKETYGYEISEQLEEHGFGKIAEGTIYPLLLRLEKNGFIQATYRISEVGPKRKYYYLTPKGNTELIHFWENYCELENAVNSLMQDVGGRKNE